MTQDIILNAITEQERLSQTPLLGEMLLTDEYKLFIGDNSTVGGNPITGQSIGEIIGEWNVIQKGLKIYRVVDNTKPTNSANRIYNSIGEAISAASTTGEVIFIKRTNFDYSGEDNNNVILKPNLTIISDFARINNANSSTSGAFSTTGKIENVKIFGLRINGNGSTDLIGAGSGINIGNGSFANEWAQRGTGWNKNIILENIELTNCGSVRKSRDGNEGASLYLRYIENLRIQNIRTFNSGNDDQHYERCIYANIEDTMSSGVRDQLGHHLHRGWKCLISGCYVELSQSDGFQFKGQDYRATDAEKLEGISNFDVYNRNGNIRTNKNQWGFNTFLACTAYKCGPLDTNSASEKKGSGFYLNEPENNFLSLVACTAIRSGDAGIRWGISYGDYSWGNHTLFCHVDTTAWRKADSQVSSGGGEKKGIWLNGHEEGIVMGSTEIRSLAQGIRVQDRTKCLTTCNISVKGIEVSGPYNLTENNITGQ